MDIFVVNRANGKTVVENLGQPMNSSGDDSGFFFLSPTGGSLPLTAKRQGDDDIYTFINEDPNLKVVNYYLEGITYTTRKDSSRQVLAETKVILLDGKGDVMQISWTANDENPVSRV